VRAEVERRRKRESVMTRIPHRLMRGEVRRRTAARPAARGEPPARRTRLHRGKTMKAEARALMKRPEYSAESPRNWGRMARRP
jgi:hypothetical protein